MRGHVDFINDPWTLEGPLKWVYKLKVVFVTFETSFKAPTPTTMLQKSNSKAHNENARVLSHF